MRPSFNPQPCRGLTADHDRSMHAVNQRPMRFESTLRRLQLGESNAAPRLHPCTQQSGRSKQGPHR